MNTPIQKLLRRVRKESGYAHFHQWEPAIDQSEGNPNRPFKPQVSFSEIGAPAGQVYEDLADNWDGGLADWDTALKHARIGAVIDFYITKIGSELLTNIEVWIKSETEIYWSEIGGSPRLISI